MPMIYQQKGSPVLVTQQMETAALQYLPHTAYVNTTKAFS